MALYFCISRISQKKKKKEVCKLIAYYAITYLEIVYCVRYAYIHDVSKVDTAPVVTLS